MIAKNWDLRQSLVEILLIKFMKIHENYWKLFTVLFVLAFKLSPCLWKFVKIFENYLQFVLVFKLSLCSKYCFLSFGVISPRASEFYVQTFRNTLPGPSSCLRHHLRCNRMFPKVGTYNSDARIYPKEITQQFFFFVVSRVTCKFCNSSSSVWTGCVLTFFISYCLLL
jgi:hypothetical protein